MVHLLYPLLGDAPCWKAGRGPGGLFARFGPNAGTKVVGHVKPDPVLPYMTYYFVALAVIGISSWLWIRSRPTAREKKLWSDRNAIIVGIFVFGFMCFTFVLWKQYLWIPLVLLFVARITYLNIRGNLYCHGCGQCSHCRNVFAKPFHCPYCGYKLR
jgi:hypothetical protein